MKILKSPDRDNEQWKDVVGCECKTSMEITENDLQLFFWLNYAHNECEYLSIICPTCGLILQNIKIPDYVERRWRKKHPRAKAQFDDCDETDYSR